MIPTIGLRVVRGPDWASSEEDGGDCEGTVGTVITLMDGGESNKNAGANTRTRTNGKVQSVTVAWDCGGAGEYRTGQDGKYDLLAIDVQQEGTHLLAQCDDCGKNPSGFRWYCVDCGNYDLCSKCYNTEKHDLTHHFTRFASTICSSVKVPTRESSAALKLEARGLFVDAKVSKDGKTGVVKEVVRNSERGEVKVQWEGESATPSTHRRDETGDIGLTCEEPTVYGTYYKDHLPLVGMRNYLIVGDIASVLMSEEEVKKLQKGHGDWIDQMSKALMQVGIVASITYRGDVKLHFPAIDQEWDFNSEAVSKLEECGVGDKVCITDDVELIKKVQAGHGEWDDTLEKDMGQEALVLMVTKTGDVKVLVNGHPLTLHPASLTVVEVDEQRPSTDWEEAQRVVLLKAMQDQVILGQLCSASSINSKKEEIIEFVNSAFDGKLDIVKGYLEKNPSWLNIMVSGKTALGTACIAGHLDVVKYLISKGANTESRDENDIRPLHCSIFGKHLKVMEYLLKQGVYVNAVCINGFTPMHLAATQNMADFISLLVKHGGNINVQDKTGDTPLHVALCQSASDCQKLLIESPKVDLLLRNHKGHGPLHYAALYKSEMAVNMMLEKQPSLVNIRKDDGYAPFHVAAFNNHVNLVKIFIEKGKCPVDMLTSKKETPLYLAVLRGGTETVEFLVSHGANINHTGQFGQTCMHLITNLITEDHYEVEDSLALRKIRVSMREIGVSSPKEALACYLVKNGGDMGVENMKGRTPWQAVRDPKFRECIERCIEIRGECPSTTPVKKPVNSLLTRLLPFLNRDPTPLIAASDHVHDQPPEDSQVSVNHFDIKDNASSPVYELFKSPFEEPQVTSTPPRTPSVSEPSPSDAAVKEARDMGAALSHSCTVCQQPITELVASPCQHVQPLSEISPSGPASASAPASTNALPPARVIAGLQRQNSEFRTALACTVCLQRKKAAVFECGHSTCQQCSELLPECPICRKPVSEVFPLFL